MRKRRRSEARRWDSWGRRKTFSKVSGGERRITAAAAELRRILTGRGLEQPPSVVEIKKNSVNSKQRMYFY